jgi:hypothetical protein
MPRASVQALDPTGRLSWNDEISELHCFLGTSLWSVSVHSFFTMGSSSHSSRLV